MKIYSAGTRRKETIDKYDSLRNQRAEGLAKQKHIYEEYEEEAHKVVENIKSQIWQELGNVSIPEFEVRCESHISVSRDGKVKYHVYVGNGRGDPTRLPFAWSYDIQLNDDGSVNRSSNSWSGLDATTPENIDILQETVDVLRKLSNMDWETLLQSSLYWNDYSDRIDEIDVLPYSAFDNEETEILEASLDDLIGDSAVVVGLDYHEGSSSLEGYYQIIGETGTSYRIKFIPSSTFDGDFAGTLADIKPSRVKKSTLVRLLSKYYNGDELEIIEF